eukprot:CAMPEP_0197036556 /NCGR_PEP_ID=MMETSP1384-20130603/14035_1 /TAXON_ID=29189 /ORGANISM="Ammonia sp." /LENGTH=129 /DNA_ID=CAMNT_0042466749 /DNA_START=53 /DNA_END=439 /DNA_ORIENTATION=-
MRQEAQRRGELIRGLLLSGYNVRVEIYERSIQEPNLPAGDIYKLKHFILGEFTDVGKIENEQIRKSHGLSLISQMAFDVRLRSPYLNYKLEKNCNGNTLLKLQEWTAKQSDIATIELDDAAILPTDREI